MSFEHKRSFLKPEIGADFKDAESWKLPDYTVDPHLAKDTAFNYDPSWNPDYEPEIQEEMLPPTQEEIEQIKRDAYQEGLELGKKEAYQEGFELGKKEGFIQGRSEGQEEGFAHAQEEGKADIEQKIDHFNCLADKLANPLELVDEQVETQLIDMILSLTKSITNVEVKTNHKVILDAVKESVKVLPVIQQEITLKLNPEDIAVIYQFYDDEAINARSWKLETDPILERGDVYIEVEDSEVVYNLDARIQEVLTAFCGQNQH